jgi:hypothetical protein
VHIEKLAKGCPKFFPVNNHVQLTMLEVEFCGLEVIR